MDQKLVIAKIQGINEVEPAIFEIVVSLEDGSRTILRMEEAAFQALANHFGASGNESEFQTRQQDTTARSTMGARA